MRSTCLRVAAAAGLGLCLALFGRPASSADIDLNASWKLVALAQLRDNEVLTVDIREHGGKLEATIAHPEEFAAPPKVTEIASKGGEVTLKLTVGPAELNFRGKPSGPSTIKGLLTLDGDRTPARLEKKGANQEFDRGLEVERLVRDFLSARNEPLPRTRVRLLRAVIAQKPDDPSLAPAYQEALRNADAAELSAEDVRKLVAQWLDVAKPYGEEYVADVAIKATHALAGAETYAPIALKLAQQADAARQAGGSLEDRAEAASTLVDAAKAAGDKTLAASAEARSEKLEGQLDEAYRRSVPPFKPEADAGPKSRASDRVVLLELFTGAECPPCVAADVAFDAMNTSYRPSKLVALQYHMHIPGPDPLTNPDTAARSEYYPDFQGTPAPFVDGKALDVPGGRMSDAEDRYEGYRKVVDEALTKPSRAAIDLKVDRKGDRLSIRAEAKAKQGQGGAKLKLRLALIEESVRYVGGNSQRFHEHVVRAMPGGVEGKALADGKATQEVTVDLAKLREDLTKYLSDYEKDGNAFRGKLPSLKLEKLAVVAYVQDDDDRSVLNAIQAPASKGD